MSVDRLMVQPLTIVKVGGSTLDEYGNTVAAAYGSPIQTTGYLEQRVSTEYLLDRDAIATNWVAYFPAGTNVSGLDRVQFGGQTFEVDGEPWQVFNPRLKAVSHLQANLKVVS